MARAASPLTPQALSEPMPERSGVRGRAGVRRFLEMVHRAFDNLEADVEVLVESGERVAWQRTLRGTHVATYVGFPATGGAIVWRDLVVRRIVEGQFVEDWSSSDLAEQLLRARKR